MVGVAHHGAGTDQRLGVTAGLGVDQARPSDLGFVHARAAKHHDGVFNAQIALGQVGLEHFQLEADAARLAAQQEFGVGKGQAVGVGQQGMAFAGVRLQFGPGIGQAAFFQVLGGFHGGSLLHVLDGLSCLVGRPAPGPAQSPMASASGTKATASALPSMIIAPTLSGSWW